MFLSLVVDGLKHIQYIDKDLTSCLGIICNGFIEHSNHWGDRMHKLRFPWLREQGQSQWNDMLRMCQVFNRLNTTNKCMQSFVYQ